MLQLRYGKIEEIAAEIGGKMTLNELPKGYIKLKYVENVSNSYPTYLVLDHKFNSSHSKLTINYQLPRYSSRRIAGCKDDGTRGKGFAISDTGYYYGEFFNSVGAVSEMICVEIGKDALYVNGELKQTFSKQPNNTCANNLAIGTTMNNSGVPSVVNGYHRIGRVKLEYDDEILFDLVPCINSDDVVGFYDLVNGVFRRSESGSDWGVPGVMTLEELEELRELAELEQ